MTTQHRRALSSAAPGASVVLTLGCRQNAAESERIAEALTALGGVPWSIVNSCAVTDEAERAVLRAVRLARRARPDAPVAVVGCAAQLAPERWAQVPGVARVLGTREKLAPECYAPDAPAVQVAPFSPTPRGAGAPGGAARVPVRLPVLSPARPAAPSAARARRFVEIQSGCDHRCTYCIIPAARGPSRSRAVESIVADIRSAVAGGVREVVLTGVDLASYRRPDGAGLGALVRQVLAEVPALARLRLSTVDPACLDDELVGAFATEARLMPHLHLSLQSGDDLILARMLRRHRVADVRAAVARLRQARPGLTLGADVIAGFPTEGAPHHAQTLRFLEELDVPWLHVFRYSPRAGTPAARLPTPPVELRAERAAELRAVGKAAAARALSALVGQEREVLCERAGVGRTPDFARVRVAAPRGALVRCRLARGADGGLVGAVVASGVDDTAPRAGGAARSDSAPLSGPAC